MALSMSPVFTAASGDAQVGYIEVARITGPDRRAGPTLADIGNLEVTDQYHRTGVATLLLQYAAGWLRLGGVDLLLAYASPDEASDSPMTAFLTRNGFSVVTTTERGWTRP